MKHDTDRWQRFLAYLALALFAASIAVYALLWRINVEIAFLFLALSQVTALALGVLGWPLWPARVAVVGFAMTAIVWGLQVLVRRGAP